MSVPVGERRLWWYDPGRQQAGETLAVLLGQREPHQGKPLVRSDALTSNTAAETPLLRCHGLAQGRRKFSELDEVFPAESAVVVAALKAVYEPDEEARAKQLSAPARLVPPQPYSAPILAALKHWLERQTAERLVAPNSSLGKALADRLGHGETRTRFLPVPGAPLDNTVADRALKLCIGQRQNSLF